MDFERTSAPHGSPPPLQPSPLDWLLRLHLRSGGAVWLSVLVGAGVYALVQGGLLSLIGGMSLEGLGGVWPAGVPDEGELVVLCLSDVAGGLATGVMARRRALLLAGLTGLVMRLPRFFAILRAPVIVLPFIGLRPTWLVDASLVVGGGLVVLSVLLWALAAWLGNLLANRRLDSLGLR